MVEPPRTSLLSALVSRVGLLRWAVAESGIVAEFKIVFGFGHVGRRTRIQRILQEIRDNHQTHDTAEINALRNGVECLARQDCAKSVPEDKLYLCKPPY